MREIFQAISELETKRPEIRRSNVWHVEKIRHEESGELLEVTSNDPTPEDKERMVAEGSDVILNVLQIYVNSGISPEVAVQGLLDKITELSERPAERFARGIQLRPAFDTVIAS